jgi:hypothetical protein
MSDTKWGNLCVLTLVRLRRSGSWLYRAFGSTANGRVAMVLIASLLWLIAMAGLPHR